MARPADPGEPESRDDRALVRAFLGGEIAAFEAIMKRHRRMVYFAALRIVGTHSDADDVAQKTFLSVHQNLARFANESALKTWIFRIAVNFAKNQVRDRSRREGEELGEGHEDPSVGAPARIEVAQRRAQVRRAVEKLPPRQREVLELRVDHELPFAEIAEVLGCSENTAKVNFHHAVKSLREKLSAAD